MNIRVPGGGVHDLSNDYRETACGRRMRPDETWWATEDDVDCEKCLEQREETP